MFEWFLGVGDGLLARPPAPRLELGAGKFRYYFAPTRAK